ncbi:ATPase Cu transporting protein 7B [Homalodisca vitripennis]|nr:ATPase Cu transporting protein 7B [Homalodisca vitripennis]
MAWTCVPNYSRDKRRYRKPTRESLSTPEYRAAVEAHNAAQILEPDTISIHRGIDSRHPSFTHSTSSTISRYVICANTVLKFPKLRFISQTILN